LPLNSEIVKETGISLRNIFNLDDKFVEYRIVKITKEKIRGLRGVRVRKVYTLLKLGKAFKLKDKKNQTGARFAPERQIQVQGGDLPVQTPIINHKQDSVEQDSGEGAPQEYKPHTKIKDTPKSPVWTLTMELHAVLNAARENLGLPPEPMEEGPDCGMTRDKLERGPEDQDPRRYNAKNMLALARTYCKPPEPETRDVKKAWWTGEPPKFKNFIGLIHDVADWTRLYKTKGRKSA
jgi:hypothetical protein